ncbi:MAG: hypothetical protein WD076_01130 [Parvularculaceae bacterium]
MTRLFLTGILPAVLAGAFATPAGADSSDKAAERLAEFERTGDTTTCLSLRSVSQITPLSETQFLVRVGVSDYYLNEVSGRCANADSAFTRLEYTTSLSQLCRGEIIRVVDNGTGMLAGSCGLGDFERLEKKKEAPAENSSN